VTGLTDDEREALLEYVEDAVVFAVGAWAEVEVGVRDVTSAAGVAAEFIAARNPVEIEALLTDRLAAVEFERDGLFTMFREDQQTIAAHEAREARVRALADELDGWGGADADPLAASIRAALDGPAA